MKWYKFDQNNSGGSFTVNAKVCHRLFIEAKDEDSAVSRAIELGVYFDGCSDGRDCECCGDRWYSPDVVELPYKWKKDLTINTVEEYAQYLADEYGWTKPDARLFFANGEIKEIFGKRHRDAEWE